jgi:hypothetical protein
VALLAGAVAAYGFAMKHWFVLIPVMCELALIARQRRDWRPVRPETVVMGAAAVAYAAAAVAFAPEFFQRIVPLVAMSYHGYGPTSANAPLALVWFLSVRAAWLLPVVLMLVLVRERRPLVWLMAVAAMMLAVTAVIQQKGFRYHYLPAEGLGLVVTVLALVHARRAVALIGVTGLLMMLFAVLPARESLHFGGREIPRPFLEPVATLQPGERVQVIDTQPEAAFILPVRVNGTHLSRHYSSWMLPGLLLPLEDPMADGRRRAELARVLAEFREDLMCRPADLVILEHSILGPWGRPEQEMNVHTLLRADPQFRVWFDGHYRREPQWEVPVWRLTGPRPADRPCRRI